jgi:hypothetical protein
LHCNANCNVKPSHDFDSRVGSSFGHHTNQQSVSSELILCRSQSTVRIWLFPFPRLENHCLGRIPDRLKDDASKKDSKFKMDVNRRHPEFQWFNQDGSLVASRVYSGLFRQIRPLYFFPLFLSLFNMLSERLYRSFRRCIRAGSVGSSGARITAVSYLMILR